MRLSEPRCYRLSRRWKSGLAWTASGELHDAQLLPKPSRSRVVRCLENKLLAADDSWWTSHRPLYTRVVAEVPLALYLNFLANKSCVASLSPRLFRPLDLPDEPDKTLFTLLLFRLERAPTVGTASARGSRCTPYAIQLEVLRPHNGAWAGFSARSFVCAHRHDVSHTERVRPSSRPLLSPAAGTPFGLGAWRAALPARSTPVEARGWYLKESRLNGPRLALFSPSNSPLTRTMPAGLLINICPW